MISSVTPAREGRVQGNDLLNSQWGDMRIASRNDCIRLGFWNCGGLPLHNRDGKNLMLREWIKQHQFDIVGLSECNVHWKNIPADQRFPERTLGWFETSHLNISYNMNWVKSTAYQVGGVLLWSINQGAHRVSQHGSDQSLMGRWCWTKYRGKNGTSLRVISGYRCVENTSGPLSAWSQQTLALEKTNCLIDPRQKFSLDILAEIKQWIEDGEHIVLGLDLNENVITATFTEKLKEAGLLELNIHRHTTLTHTYIRGTSPIDGLYVSPALADSSCGYLPFLGDHRPLWVDIPIDTVFGHNIITQPKARRLKLLDPRTVDRYSTYLETYLKEHHLLERIELLQYRSDVKSEAYLQEYNEIDQLRTRGMHLAEKQCRKLRMGETPFTPEYSRLSKSVLVWSLICKLKSGQKVDSRYFNRQLKLANLSRDYVNPLTLHEAEAQRKVAYQQLNSYSKKASTSRTSWLGELAAARALSNDSTAEQELISLIQREKQRKTARLIKNTIKTPSSMGLSMIQVNQNHTTQEVTDKDSMEQHLIAELTKRFHQASATPFASFPLLQLIGKMGDTANAQAILNGTFQAPSDLDYWTSKLIPHLQYIPQAALIQNEFQLQLSMEDHAEGWKKMKERTSPGYSALSFAQFKAAAKNPESCAVDSILAEIPYRTGISPDRWLHGIDVMLQKQIGNFQIEKLRAILLYEADFNQNNKRYGRQLMYLAEKHNALAIEQFGSRKNRSAIDQSLNKSLTYDLWRQHRSSGALCSNDAKSCYDRILHNFASLCLQRLGSPIEPIRSMLTTIQKLHHHIRTTHGTSTQAFSGQHWTSPIHGVGQGNGAGPQIWAAVSTPLLNMLRSEGCGAFLKSAMTSNKVHFVGYAFVDDTDLVASHYGNTTGAQSVRNIQLSLSAWQGGLHASGGAIVPEKSHWYYIDFQWNGDKMVYKKADKAPGQLQVKDHLGQMQTLKLLQPWEALKTLGVHLAPDGNMNTQVEHMRQLSVTWSDRIRAGHLPRNMVSQAMVTTIFKSLEYPLPVTTLTQTQCEYIVSPILQHCLPRMGIVRSFPRILAHAKAQHQGIEIPNLYWLQGYYHIERLLKFHGSSQLSGALLRHSLESLRLEVGCNGSLFQLPFDTFGILATPSWVVHTWEFLDKHHINVDLPVPEFSLRRVNDALLIPLFVSHGYTGHDLQQLNLCRIFLQVSCLSDICLGCGKQINRSSWNGRIDSTQQQLYHWPPQPAPHYSAWILWKQALSKLCHTPFQLITPLGKWINNTVTLYLVDQISSRIYLRSGIGNFYFRKMPGRPSRKSVDRFGGKLHCEHIPVTAIPATVEYHHSYLYLTGWDTVTPHTESTFSEFLPFLFNQSPATTGWVFQSVKFTGDFGAFENACQQRIIQLQAVSDGSFKDSHGTASWRISISYNADNYICGSTVAPGPPVCQSAYRSELTGIYAICMTLRAIQKFYNRPILVEIGCDGLSAIKMCQVNEDTISPNVSHFDLIYAIRAILRQLQGTVTWRFIKGHQDDSPDTELDIWAQFNVQMDAAAKQYWSLSHEIPLANRPNIVFAEPGSIWLHKEKIVMDLKERLLNYLSAIKSVPYWENKLKLGEGGGSKIHWKMIGYARLSLPRSRQHWISKTTSGFFGSGKMMQRWKLKSDASCPRCSFAVEDTLHIIRCPDIEANALWDTRLKELQYWLVQQYTSPILAQCVCDRLTKWRKGQQVEEIPPTLPLPFHEAIREQDLLGWDKFILGFWPLQWEGAQSMYLQSLQCKLTIKRWIISIIRKLWDIIWDMWEHRNEKLHNSEQGELVLQLNTEVAAEYRRGHSQLSRKEKTLFQRPVTSILQSSIPYKQLWLQRIQSARQKQSLRQIAGQQAYASERRQMQLWTAPTTH